MIDIHSHILPGVEDGPAHLEEALEMVKMAARDGVREIIATPRIWDHQLTSREQLVESYLTLKDEMLKRYPDMTLHLGFEVYLSVTLLDQDYKSRLKELHKFVLATSRSVLVEFDRLITLDHMTELVVAVNALGLIPIIAHAEVYESLHFGTSSLESLRAAGALIQVSGGAVLGMSGYATKKWIKSAISLGLVDFVASDEKCSGGRNRQFIGNAYNDVKWQFGSDMADHLFKWNGQWLLQGADQQTLHTKTDGRMKAELWMRRGIVASVCFAMTTALLIGFNQFSDRAGELLWQGQSEIALVEVEEESIALGAPSVTADSQYLRKNEVTGSDQVDRSTFDIVNETYEQALKSLANEGVHKISAETETSKKAKIYNDYFEAFQSLEKESDKAISKLLETMSEQLKEKNQSTDLTKTLWAEYLQLKAERQNRYKLILLRQP